MAQELDPQLLQCDHEDGRLAVAFGTYHYHGPNRYGGDEWSAVCPACLAEHDSNEEFFYVRFRDDPAAPADAFNDTADHADDDPALKF